MRLLMKRTFLFFGLLLAALVCFGQVKSGAYRVMLKNLLSHSVPEIQVQQAAIDSANIVFLDAREPKEYEVSHISKAIPVGYDNFKIENLPVLNKDQRIVVYCSVGYRSEKVTEQLRTAGFTNIANLYGGIFEWVNQGFPVYDALGLTEHVHGFSRTWGVWLHRGKKVYGK